MTKVKRVFCKDCVFMKRQSNRVAPGVMAEIGVCTRIVKENPTWFGYSYEYPINPSQQNKDNDCKYFLKRDWLSLTLFKLPPKLRMRF